MFLNKKRYRFPCSAISILIKQFDHLTHLSIKYYNSHLFMLKHFSHAFKEILVLMPWIGFKIR